MKHENYLSFVAEVKGKKVAEQVRRLDKLLKSSKDNEKTISLHNEMMEVTGFHHVSFFEA